MSAIVHIFDAISFMLVTVLGPTFMLAVAFKNNFVQNTYTVIQRSIIIAQFISALYLFVSLFVKLVVYKELYGRYNVPFRLIMTFITLVMLGITLIYFKRMVLDYEFRKLILDKECEEHQYKKQNKKS